MWMRCECDCNGCIGRCGDAWNAEMIPEETMVLLYSPLGAYTPWVWGKTVGANSENMGDGTYREQHENNARARAHTHTHTHMREGYGGGDGRHARHCQRERDVHIYIYTKTLPVKTAERRTRYAVCGFQY